MKDCIKIKSELRYLSNIDSSRIVISSFNEGLQIREFESCSILKNISIHLLPQKIKLLAISNDGKFLVYILNSTIYLMQLSTKMVIKKVEFYDEEIEKLYFSDLYLFIVSKSARVFQYQINGLVNLGRIYSSKKDSKITAIKTYNDFIAIGCDNGNITLKDQYLQTNKISISNHINSIVDICFLDEDIIITGDIKGELYVNSLKTNLLLKTISTPFTKLKQILKVGEFFLAIGNQKYISLYQKDDFKLLKTNYINFKFEIEEVIVVDNYNLIVVLINGGVKKIKLADTEELKSLILHNSLDKAYDFCKNNYIIQTTKEYIKLENIYKDYYEQALKTLLLQQKKRAMEIIEIFKDVDCKKFEIVELFKGFDNFEKFKHLYSEQKYPLAYNMSEKFPVLKKTFQYKKIDEHWKEMFQNAQRQIAFDRYDNAKALLDSYSTVLSKRSIINLLLKDNKKFIKFLKATESNNIELIDSLAQQNPLFKDIPSYKDCIKIIENELKEIELLMLKGSISKLKDRLNKLSHIKSVEKKVAMLLFQLEIIEKFYAFYAKDNFIKCYELRDKHYFLRFNALDKLLQKHLKKVIQKAEVYAIKTDMRKLKQELNDIIEAKSLRKKVGDLFRVSFLTKIKMLLKKKLYKKAERVIYSYIDNFGLDIEINILMQIYEDQSNNLLAITQDQVRDDTRERWLKYI